MEIADQSVTDHPRRSVGDRRPETRARSATKQQVSRVAKSIEIANLPQVDHRMERVGDRRPETTETVPTEAALSRVVKSTEIANQTSLDHQLDGVGDGRPETALELFTKTPVSRVASICVELVVLQRQRMFCIKQQSRANRSIESYIARLHGFHTGLEEKERKRIFKAAADLRKAVEGGAEDQQLVGNQAINVLRSLILASAIGRQQWDELRTETEKTMRAKARELPVWPWVEEVKGLSDLGLAVIVGEAGGALSNYRSPPALWKRMGLAVLAGNRQGAPGAGATAKDWIVHGYNRTRRSEIWNFCDDMIVRAQWLSERAAYVEAIKNHPAALAAAAGDGIILSKLKLPDLINLAEPFGITAEAHGTGPYGVQYGEWKAKYLERSWEKARADKAARRRMTKRVLRNLWRVWRDSVARDEC